MAKKDPIIHNFFVFSSFSGKKSPGCENLLKLKKTLPGLIIVLANQK
jgi:hypothetical protein